jgi:hypothetical protein
VGNAECSQLRLPAHLHEGAGSTNDAPSRLAGAVVTSCTVIVLVCRVGVGEQTRRTATIFIHRPPRGHRAGLKKALPSIAGSWSQPVGTGRTGLGLGDQASWRAEIASAKHQSALTPTQYPSDHNIFGLGRPLPSFSPSAERTWCGGESQTACATIGFLAFLKCCLGRDDDSQPGIYGIRSQSRLPPASSWVVVCGAWLTNLRGSGMKFTRPLSWTCPGRLDLPWTCPGDARPLSGSLSDTS